MKYHATPHPRLDFFDDPLRLALLKESRRYREFWAEYAEPFLAELRDQPSYPGKPPSWEYKIFRDGKIVHWEWEAATVTAADHQRINARIAEYVKREGYGRGSGIGLGVIDYLIAQVYRISATLTTAEYYKLYDKLADDYPILAQADRISKTLRHDFAINLRMGMPWCQHWRRVMASLDPYNDQGSRYVRFRRPQAIFAPGLGDERPPVTHLAVDLSRPKHEIIAAMKGYLDNIARSRASSNSPKLAEKLRQWEPVKAARQTPEVWRHIEVWRQRRQGKPFFQIAEDMGITIDKAKDSFTVAFELVEGRKYDRVLYRVLYRETLPQEVVTPCHRCKDAASCDPLTDNCKKMLEYWNRIASQVEGGRREQFIEELAPEKQRKIGAF